VVAVKLAGAALIVVATPLTVERTGVIVATGFPLASTDTQGSRGLSVTEQRSLGFCLKQPGRDTHQLCEWQVRQILFC
jgi:hypothetical protein